MKLPRRSTSGPRRPSSVGRVIYRATKRLEGHTIALGLLVAAVGLAMAWVAWESVNGVPLQQRYELNAVIPTEAPVLAKGDVVRVAGRLAGIITDVKPYKGNRKVTMELRPAFAPVGRDASAKVRVKSLVYLTYLELQPGNINDAMAAGGTIPLARTGSNVDLLEVVQLFDKRSREALKRTIYDTGVGLAGRGGELNSALGDLPALTYDGSSELRALTSTRGAIARSVAGAERVARGLGGARGDDVAALLRAGNTTLRTIAGRSPELDETIRRLRPVEDELLATSPLADPVLDETTRLSRTLEPVFGRLERALPSLNRTLASGDELRRQTARLTGYLRPVLRAATPVIAALEPTVATIDPLRRPLNRLTGTLDPYENDITRAAGNIIAATRLGYAEGQTAPNSATLRFAPIFACHPNRNPYPKPGVARRQAKPC